jgi:hypothetical protein
VNKWKALIRIFVISDLIIDPETLHWRNQSTGKLASIENSVGAQKRDSGGTPKSRAQLSPLPHRASYLYDGPSATPANRKNIHSALFKAENINQHASQPKKSHQDCRQEG